MATRLPIDQDPFVADEFPILGSFASASFVVLGGLRGTSIAKSNPGTAHVVWIDGPGIPVVVFEGEPGSELSVHNTLFPIPIATDTKWPERHGGGAIRWTNEPKLKRARISWERADVAEELIDFRASWDLGGSRRGNYVGGASLAMGRKSILAKPFIVVVARMPRR